MTKHPLLKKAKTVSDSFFLNDAPEVACNLIGKILMREDGRMGRIVETEAYTQNDEASHTFNGKTARNEAMFMKGGHLYVYFTYGCHFCANIVTGKEGFGSGVLLRAVEPLAGMNLMRQARQKEDILQLCSGPGKLAQAFGIDRNLYGIDLREGGVLSIWDDGCVLPIEQGPRIGVSKGKDTLWRFWAQDNPYVSGKKGKKMLRKTKAP